MENLTEERQTIEGTVIYHNAYGFWTGEEFSLIFNRAKKVTRLADLRKETQRARVIAFPVYAIKNCGQEGDIGDDGEEIKESRYEMSS